MQGIEIVKASFENGCTYVELWRYNSNEIGDRTLIKVQLNEDKSFIEIYGVKIYGNAIDIANKLSTVLPRIFLPTQYPTSTDNFLYYISGWIDSEKLAYNRNVMK